MNLICTYREIISVGEKKKKKKASIDLELPAISIEKTLQRSNIDPAAGHTEPLHSGRL